MLDTPYLDHTVASAVADGRYFDFRDRLARQIRRSTNGEAPFLKIGVHEALDFAMSCGAPDEPTAAEWAERFMADLRRHRDLRLARHEGRTVPKTASA